MSEKRIGTEELASMPYTSALVDSIIAVAGFAIEKVLREKGHKIREEVAEKCPGQEPAVALGLFLGNPSGSHLTISISGAMLIEAKR